MTPLCFIDTETTGVHPNRQVWDVAMIRREPDGHENVAQFFIDVDLSNADPFGLSIGGFYERHPAGQWLSSHFAPAEFPQGSDIGRYLNRKAAARHIARLTHGAHLVGAVPNFDAETLAPLLREYGLIPAWHYHLIDVEALAVGWLIAKGRVIRPPWKSDDLSHAVQILSESDQITAPDQERHTALGDARWAMRLYDAITKGS